MAHSVLVTQTTVLKETFSNLLKRRLLSKYESIGVPRTLCTEIWLGSCAISELKNSYYPKEKNGSKKRKCIFSWPKFVGWTTKGLH